MTLVTKSNALGKAAKEKTLQLQGQTKWKVRNSKRLLKHFDIIFVEPKLLYFCILNYFCTSFYKMSFQRLNMLPTMAELFKNRK